MHEIHLTHGNNKEAIYQQLLPQIESLISEEPSLIANLANIAAVLKTAFDWLWVGFYLEDAQRHELVLGPFQGPVACTRIPYGRGVCGQAWAGGKTIVVSDVNAHPDHIACSSLSQSEIVVPIFDTQHDSLIAVLDVDADTLNRFDDTDSAYLGKLAALIAQQHSKSETTDTIKADVKPL